MCGLVAADFACPACETVTLHRDPAFDPRSLLRESLVAALDAPPLADTYQFAAHPGQRSLVRAGICV